MDYVGESEKVHQAAVDAVVEMYNGGATISDICEEMGKSVTTVYALLREGGIVPHRAQEVGPKRVIDVLPKELVDQVVSDYVKGVTMSKIMSVAGLTVNTVYKILRETDTPMRMGKDNREVHYQRVEQAIRMYQNGDKLIKIEMETGVQPTQLYKALAKASVPLRRDIP